MQELPKTVHQAANGDPSLVAKIVGSDGPIGAVGWGLALGVFCSEQVPYVTSQDALAEAKKALPGFPESVLTPRVTQAPTLAWDCSTWNVAKASPDPHRPVTSDVPTLVLEGALDAVTPPENGKAVLPGLSRSQYVEVPGSGHDTVLWQGACIQPLMNAFLLRPTDPVDISCVKALADPTFTTS
jgi:pimeloyl-ACP methyl ester carboxylesterase